MLPTGLDPCTADKATSTSNALSQETETVSYIGQWGQLRDTEALEEPVAGPLGTECPSNKFSAMQSRLYGRCPHTEMVTWTLDEINHSN